ncbi:hypothetical protein [Schaalia suimastitidis]|uniref:hypothetical protein n=1 Tax=Schaalia suimastitidis TaxID=121163 RepID=UPI00041A6A5A|nr:hypothetical protein [Schaalia suimastitidis]
MKNSLLRITLAVTLALGLSGGLAACSSSGTTSNSDTSSSAAADSEDAETKADLELALTTVKETLETNPDLTQIYLANDVDKPTEKYGMLVVPYDHSDATEKLTTSIVEIQDGKFIIGAVAAASQKTWQIDQDGTITEVTE